MPRMRSGAHHEVTPTGREGCWVVLPDKVSNPRRLSGLKLKPSALVRSLSRGRFLVRAAPRGLMAPVSLSA